LFIFSQITADQDPFIFVRIADMRSYFLSGSFLTVKNCVLSKRKLSSTLRWQKSFVSCIMKLSCCMTCNLYVKRVNKKVCCRTVVQSESFMWIDMKLCWHPSVLESFLLLNTQFFTVPGPHRILTGSLVFSWRDKSLYDKLW
jgi:hypothetical protein